MKAPAAAPIAFGPMAARTPTAPALIPNADCHTASPDPSATIDPASRYEAMPARTVHFHCCLVMWPPAPSPDRRTGCSLTPR
jgi:hypothetical protein